MDFQQLIKNMTLEEIIGIICIFVALICFILLRIKWAGNKKDDKAVTDEEYADASEYRKNWEKTRNSDTAGNSGKS